MPKITATKVGSVFLKQVGAGKWRVSYMDPLMHKHVRQMLPAASFEDARDQAKTINRDVASERGFQGRLRGRAGHTIADLVLEAVRHTNATEQTRKDYLRRYNAFAAYLRENAPGVTAWGDVTTAVLENYLEHCRREGMAHDSIRLRLFVLRLASSYAARVYPNVYRDAAAAVRLRRRANGAPGTESKKEILSPEQMRGLLGWLEKKAPMVHVWATLQGLCGLRLFEAAYLREGDIDFEGGTLAVSESDAHRPKNASSYRTIPVCGETLRVLRGWITGARVQHMSGYLFVPQRASYGRVGAKSTAARVGAFTQDAICHFWGKALSKARLALDLPARFVPRKLRASFVTALRSAGADLALVQKYVGHRPLTVLSAHYDDVTLDRLRVLAGLAQDLFEGKGAFEAAQKEAEKPGGSCINAAS